MNITANDMGEQKEMTQLMHMNERITVKLSLTKLSKHIFQVNRFLWKQLIFI